MGTYPVSYTHLDVYKRQGYNATCSNRMCSESYGKYLHIPYYYKQINCAKRSKFTLLFSNTVLGSFPYTVLTHASTTYSNPYKLIFPTVFLPPVPYLTYMYPVSCSQCVSYKFQFNSATSMLFIDVNANEHLMVRSQCHLRLSLIHI